MIQLRYHCTSFILFFCILVASLGNASLVTCIEQAPNTSMTRMQLFHCLETSPVLTFNTRSSAGFKDYGYEERCPFCVDAHLDFNVGENIQSHLEQLSQLSQQYVALLLGYSQVSHTFPGRSFITNTTSLSRPLFKQLAATISSTFLLI